MLIYLFAPNFSTQLIMNQVVDIMECLESKYVLK